MKLYTKFLMSLVGTSINLSYFYNSLHQGRGPLRLQESKVESLNIHTCYLGIGTQTIAKTFVH